MVLMFSNFLIDPAELIVSGSKLLTTIKLATFCLLNELCNRKTNISNRYIKQNE